jgi:hypothetical protein
MSSTIFISDMVTKGESGWVGESGWERETPRESFVYIRKRTKLLSSTSVLPNELFRVYIDLYVEVVKSFFRFLNTIRFMCACVRACVSLIACDFLVCMIVEQVN